MRRFLLIAAVLVMAAVTVAVAYQTAARERDYRALLVRGDSALGDEQTFAAIEAYSGAIALRPDSMLAHLRRGETYQRRGELDEAARDFRTASALDPTATRPLEALGDVLYQLRRYDRAAETYATDLRLDDRSATVSYKLALARYRNGDLDGALETLSGTLKLEPQSSDSDTSSASASAPAIGRRTPPRRSSGPSPSLRLCCQPAKSWLTCTRRPAARLISWNSCRFWRRSIAGMSNARSSWAWRRRGRARKNWRC